MDAKINKGYYMVDGQREPPIETEIFPGIYLTVFHVTARNWEGKVRIDKDEFDMVCRNGVESGFTRERDPQKQTA